MFSKDIPFILLNDSWQAEYVHDKIKEKYGVLLEPGFFSDLLAGYKPDHFDMPVMLSAPESDLNGIKLMFIRDDAGVRCYPVKNEIYGDMAQRNVHYQMREPITSIFALMPILTDNINKGDSISAVSSLEKINRQSYKLLKNITNMTLVSKIMGNSIPFTETVNLSSLTENLVSSVKAVEKNVTIVTETDSEIYVNGNIQMLTTALLNLISNSINFRCDESVEIKIRLKKNSKNAILTYTDNSKGIKDEYLTQVFRPYFSKDPFADGESDPSMGLGLYIAKAAFEQAGGRIILTSNFGNGVKYNISIPLENNTDHVLESSATDFLLNRYSELFVQLCDSCKLPELK